MVFGELTILIIWLVLLVSSARGGRDAGGTLLLGTAPLLLGLYYAVMAGRGSPLSFSGTFGVLRLPGVGVPMAYLAAGAVYVYCIRELGRGAARVSGTMKALSWLPRELRYILFLGILTLSAWPAEWVALRLGFWSWGVHPGWTAPFLLQVYRYYCVFVFGGIVYAGALAWLVGAAGASRR